METVAAVYIVRCCCLQLRAIRVELGITCRLLVVRSSGVIWGKENLNADVEKSEDTYMMSPLRRG